MTQTFAKISLFLGIILILGSCNAVKHVPEDQFLLTKNTVNVDGEESTENGVLSQLSQKPNPKFPILGIPFGLHIYNLADQKPDSTFYAWLHKSSKRERKLVNFLSEKQVDALDSSYVGFNKWLQKSGDAPVVIADDKTQKSIDRLKRYYASYGWLNAKARYSVEINKSKKKRAAITYDITRFRPYFVDSIIKDISSPVVDSLFKQTKGKTFITEGKQYDANNFNNERARLTLQFRNSGLYYFDQDYVGFEADTVNTDHKVLIKYIIPDRKVTIGDSTFTVPFKVHKVNEVRVITDYSYGNQNRKWGDSASFKGYNLYSYDQLAFRPKAITDAISIAPGKVFKDIDRTLTYNQISDLGIFKYPNITYQTDPRDSTGTGLIATVLLTPRKKHTLGVDFDAYTSTIQQFGIGFSSTFLTRNVFRGAETLEISGRGSVGSAKDQDDNESFFNISEVGGDVKLSFPQILLPINTDSIIPKYMSPRTSISIGFGSQNNIGLDRQTVSNIVNYSWKPSKIKTYGFDLMNIQFVRNLNRENYYNVYTTSYNRLNEIARDVNYDFIDDSNNPLVLQRPSEGFNEADLFIEKVLTGNIPDAPFNSGPYKDVLSIAERKHRLTENNLIFASNFTWSRNTRENVFDKDFEILRFKVESAGNLLAGISNIAGLQKNDNDQHEALGVAFSQYAKGEVEYIKHFQLKDDDVLALRAFGGLAIPYGNSTSIPFARSYFGGGANDNRGWRAYDLGPGSSGGVFDFNEANFKLSFNAEYRYTILGAFKGAFFIDAGNIWNVLDDVDIPESRFDGIADLKEIAVASGFGVRYDFGFFVLRCDAGFKTHDPGRPVGERWFKDYNFSNVVLNIGINYPF
ncbi:MAG: hypothetical protein ACI86C_000690 [Candidatus Latescibacterota bacterium]